MNTNKQLEIIITWIILATLFLGGCAPAQILPGQVDAIQPGTSLYIMREARDLAWGTIRLQKGDIVMLAKYLMDTEAWGAVMVNSAAQNPIDDWALLTGGTGTAFNRQDFAKLITDALGNGWKVITAIPPALSLAIDEAGSWVRVMPSNIPILVVPGVFFELPSQVLPPAGIIE